MLIHARPGWLAVVTALGLVSAGCATKRYVRATVAPLDAKVAQLDKRTADKDKELATGIEALENDLSRTKELLSDADAKAAAADVHAARAEGKAVKANLAAEQAHSLAGKSLDRTELLERVLEARDKLDLRAEKTVLFQLNSSELTPEGKAALDELAAQLPSIEHYVVELQGYTDRTGGRALNLSLSQRRAEAAARYLTLKHNVPLRRVHMLGAGEEDPVADNSTRAGRAQNRRVAVRVYAPSAGFLRREKQAAANDASSRQLVQEGSGQ